ncbi:MAG: hypothetical protein IT376_12985 [Polyangiaceae bacterium]|nr:hypothetical protein [Polyangiaceae bacterium]
MQPMPWVGRVFVLAAAGLALSVASCSANDPGGRAGGASGGSGGSAAGGATGGFSGTSGGAGSSGTGGTGGVTLDAGTDAPDDVVLTDGPGVTQDAPPDVLLTDACSDAGYAPGPLARLCATATADECDGATDPNPLLANGATGNGFDDDCDGLVDEGCDCGAAVGSGETKWCTLASSTQADASGKPVGWCEANAVGTMKCVTEIVGEFTYGRWDGECRGALPPYADDVCAPGDFDCDGAPMNSRASDCSCEGTYVECPTAEIVTAPFPPPSALPFLDGHAWIKNVAPTQATGWRWTAYGGDCDNILPNPSFQMFNNPSGGIGPVGQRTPGLGPTGTQVGLVAGAAQAATHRMHLGFALSGDYVVTGEFDLLGKHYACTTKVKVRAPGIRAELCWTNMPADVDLHFARLQNPDTCDGPGHGWFNTCREDQRGDDCYYMDSSGCTGSPAPAWGYPVSPTTACHGWGSRRDAFAACDNPRLDFDNISCDPLIKNPHGFLGANDFCGAENINHDAPNDGDRFAIGAHAFAFSGEVQPHLNVYCNGERRLSLGYVPGVHDFPRLDDAGGFNGGDLWSAAVVEAVVSGGQLVDCLIDVTHSVTPVPDRDGSTNVCVDRNPQAAPTPLTERDWLFQPGGAYPTTADELCWH